MVLSYFIFIKSMGRYGFRLFLLPFDIPSNIEPLDARGAAASIYKTNMFLLRVRF